jgi:hypothetical protein
MSLTEFRAIAQKAIERGEAVYGRYYVDLADKSVYCVSRWLNLNSIAFDRLVPYGDSRWPNQYLRAMEPRRFPDEMTIFIEARKADRL